ncbi:GRIP and coiled-coil domain-containing protein 1 [Antennarius striatus]|uniref:GRIP and coiled-coil domain-containing protein 1 n=1 Tax=Antennarius striatus TaxID=241820 RepID=UPI0035B33287
MEKFGMSFGGGPSRKELLDTIEAQKKKLVQYQTRFRDVVLAYRSLLKEKEALEASLKVLSAPQEGDQEQPAPDAAATDAFLEAPDDGCSLHSEDSEDTTASADRGEEQSEEEQAEPGDQSGAAPLRSDTDGSENGSAASERREADPRVTRLRSQLSTLTGALATVTQEKSRMEAGFQADRRQLKQEAEELREQTATAAAQQEAELEAVREQLAESRARVITQQHEREQEQGDHAQQLRELQRLLQQERAGRQDAELRLQDASAAALATARAADRGAESEARLSEATEERDELRRRLLAAEEERGRPNPQVEELRCELAALKEHFQQQIGAETQKASEAEERARQRAQAAEARAAGLELRVSELSDVLGASEKTRQRDQRNAQRLRDRLLQLDAENKTLAMAAAAGRAAPDADDSQLDFLALKEKLEKVKKLLLLAAQREPQRHLLEEEEEQEEQGADPGEHSAPSYQQELRQVREEFERYKLRAQVVLKNKNVKDGCQARELEELRDQLGELKEKYISLRIQSDEADAHHRQQLEERRRQEAELQHAHRQEAERLEGRRRDELLQLEAELHKQRERTMALLEEKDRELERLRLAAASGPPERREEEEEVEATEGDAVGHALRRATSNEPALLLYSEQLARMEVELGGLRRQKHRLEDDVHRLQAKLIANGERHEEEAEHLRAQLDKLIRDQSREGANMEYLKNIVFRFLTLQDAGGRKQTLNAILTILHFSPQEKQSVARLQGAPWWVVGKR